jgi:SNF2 family DNA or RNA helicase
MSNKLKLHDYQKRAIDFCLQKKTVFLMLDMGLGKTAIALKTMAMVGGPTLVLAPLRPAISTWPSEISKWTPHLSWTVLHGKNKNENLRKSRHIYILNYDGLKWFMGQMGRVRFGKKFNLILDESSFIKSPSTIRFKTLRKLSPLWSDYKLCLSATPAPNGLHELWSQYNMLDNGKRLGKTFFGYRGQYFNYSGPPVFRTTIRPGSAQLIFDKVKDVTFRLDAKDHLKLPPIMYNAINLNLTNKLYKQYKQLETDFFLDINNQEVAVFNSAALSSKLRQFISGNIYLNRNGDYEPIHNLKLKALEELRESTSKPILCPVQFKFSYYQIAKKYKNVPIIAGITSTADAERYIKEWNRGNIPLLLCHPASLGHGVNLQAGGSVVLWYDLTWSLEQYHQLNGRLHRQGQKDSVVIHHLLINGTIDKTVLDVLKRKNATQKTLLDELRKESNYGNISK